MLLDELLTRTFGHIQELRYPARMKTRTKKIDPKQIISRIKCAAIELDESARDLNELDGDSEDFDLDDTVDALRKCVRKIKLAMGEIEFAIIRTD
jgi:hypothetical protein